MSGVDDWMGVWGACAVDGGVGVTCVVGLTSEGAVRLGSGGEGGRGGGGNRGRQSGEREAEAGTTADGEVSMHARTCTHARMHTYVACTQGRTAVNATVALVVSSISYFATDNKQFLLVAYRSNTCLVYIQSFGTFIFAHGIWQSKLRTR